MNKKGFTLIELLSVIVILAIIALIATPIVIGIIGNSKISTINISVQNYLKAVEISLEKNMLTNLNNKISNGVYMINKEGNICIGTYIDNLCNGNILEIEINGEVPTGGVIEIKDSKVGYYELDISEKTLYKINPTKEDCFETKENADGTLTINRFICAPKVWDASKSMTITNTNKINNIVDVIIPTRIGNKIVTSIGNHAFERNNINSIIISPSITTIELSAFYENNLSSAKIPSSVTNVGNYAFSGNKLTNIVISEGVKTIGLSSFERNRLTNLEIPSSVINIGVNAFFGNKLKDECAYIYARNSDGSIDYTTIIGYGGQSKDIVIPREKNGIKLTTIGEKAFLYNYLTSVIIPEGVTTIGDLSFERNNLTNIIIPESVTTIGVSAFYANKLTSIEIPKYVTTIGRHTFYGNQLTSIEIPSNITSIGHQAFDNNKLTSVIIKNKSGLSDFKTFGGSVFGWEEGYSDEDITWQS